MRRMTVARAGKRDARGVTLDAVQLSKEKGEDTMEMDLRW